MSSYFIGLSGRALKGARLRCWEIHCEFLRGKALGFETEATTCTLFQALQGSGGAPGAYPTALLG